VRARRRIRTTRTEEGIALLISIFILLLISVVAIALIVSSGTESALAGNYRSATGVYYAALAGLEEARGRLLAKNPNSFKNTTPPAFMPSPLPVGNPVYIINPAGGETVAPWDQSSKYPDTEYRTEFGADPPNPSPSANSVSGVGGVQGPLYKWVRINAVSEQSLGLDVDGNGVDASLIYYDNTNSKLTTAPASSQVLEITSFAVLPNGSQKILQYLVALVPVKFPDFPSGQLSFPAALTLSGSTGKGAAFHAPASNSSYAVKGDDQDCSPIPVLTGAKYPAIGVFTGADLTSATNGIPSAYRPNYTGSNPAPDVENISSIFPASLQTPSKLDALAQSIAQNADVIIPSGPITYPLPTVTGSALTPLGMASTNPLTVVVNGNLDISSWNNDGYGLLLVIGTFTYDPDTSWNGIILVIGQGIVNGSHSLNKQINGAMLVAKTRDPSGNLLPDPNLGGASVQFTDSMQGNGIRYSACWIQKSQPTSGYKILSFHEISQ
jgi:hypothetical protein